MKYKTANLNASKKADISITLLVVMTIALCSIAIFIFLSQSKQSASQMVDAGSIQKFIFEERGFEMYMQSLAENITSQIKDSGAAITKEEFSRRFSSTLKDASANYLPLFNFEISEGEYELSEENNILNINLKGFTFKKSPASPDSDIKSISIKKDILLKIPIS